MTEETLPAAAMGRREWLLLAVLAGVQFLHILDFVIVMPLGPRLMRELGLSAREFGMAVSAYTFSAAAAGLAGAAVMDRFDRRRVLLFLLAGFGVGTLLCALAPTYPALLGARIVAGAFGGVLAAVVLAIVGDEIPSAHRGMAMGVVMAGFSAASVLGLPLGLELAGRIGWHAPFVLIAILTAVVLVVTALGLPPMRSHLGGPRRGHPLRELADLARHPDHLAAFAVAVTLVLAGFTIIPYLSPYLVQRVGMPESQLGLVYLAGGLATLVSGPLVGRLSDRFGHVPVFLVAASASLVPVLGITNLPRVPVWMALVVTTVFMVTTSSRFVSAMALITGVVPPVRRGGFMSLNSAVQQVAAGGAALLGGWILGDSPDALARFPLVGIVGAAATLLAMPLVVRLGRRTLARGRPLPDAGAGAPVSP